MKNIFAWLTLSLLLISSSAAAQCVNSAQPSCDVYDRCFAQACPCAGDEHEYFVSYGKKYCKVFLDLPGLSSEGKKWRDSTLRCLQESIVPKLPSSGSECNCQTMETYAYASHVDCYTKPAASICDLPVADWWKIFAATDPVTTLTTSAGASQLLDVSLICLKTAVGDKKKVIEQVIAKLKP